MAESHAFVRIPPDSTGKRIAHTVSMEVTYGNGTIPFKDGDIVTGLTSGIKGTVVTVEGDTVSGTLHIHLDIHGYVIPNNPAFVLAEALQVNGVTFANASSTGYAYYVQYTSLVSHDNIHNGITIDKHGAMHTRFPGGAPTFDAFGKMQVSQQVVVAEYTHRYKLNLNSMSQNLVGSGAITHLPDSGGLLFTVGSDAGAIAELVSHQYHPYRLGTSRLCEFTMQCGDAGKNGLVRIWGYGDDDDGIFFMQYNGIWYVRIKSTVTGVPTDQMIPQTEWNADRLDGTGGIFNPSGESFDLTKNNITWMDLQWLGAGTVRFGAIINGNRIICHEWHHSNMYPGPYIRTGSLPVYFELKNQTATASASEMKVWCAAVKNEGEWKPPSDDYGHTPSVVTLNDTTRTVICSFRAKQTLHGLTNRKSSYLSDVTIIPTAAPVLIEIWKNGVISGSPVFVAPHADGCLEFDEAGLVDVSAAKKIHNMVCGVGASNNFKVDDVFNTRDEGIRRHFNPAESDVYTLTATRIGTTATDVIVAINWDDV